MPERAAIPVASAAFWIRRPRPWRSSPRGESDTLNRAGAVAKTPPRPRPFAVRKSLLAVSIVAVGRQSGYHIAPSYPCLGPLALSVCLSVYLFLSVCFPIGLSVSLSVCISSIGMCAFSLLSMSAAS
ncbi:uncharacterized protein BJ171DRAFT_519984 [Polychytrium aggregatum]|uniref:uncharacterized protein n=1 Tax=Polychytrium aggregatum TaxID=110093 RepID=UPI0022FDD7CD|nr:uncharacterized protein BJ171DRAFT_519984 [Polychytrium aggregatum]KAI9197343.1 hypothetical protein BJ171DRAFT_519984 [Polychytrium aggregatum]